MPASAPRTARDPVSGVLSVIPDLTGKPIPDYPRTLPPLEGPCPLCRLVSSLDDSGQVSDGDVLRPVTREGRAWLVVPNRWPLFPPPHGRADLVVLRRHATQAEELYEEELSELIEIVSPPPRREDPGSRAVAFMTVGVEAGGSQQHAHAQQVEAYTLPAKQTPHRSDSQDKAWEDDERLARRSGLALPCQPAPGAALWVAAAPSVSGEVRLYAQTAREAAQVLAPPLAALRSVGGWAYTLMFCSSHPFRIRVLPKLPSLVAHEQGLGVSVIQVDPEKLHARMAEHMSAR